MTHVCVEPFLRWLLNGRDITGAEDRICRSAWFVDRDILWNYERKICHDHPAIAWSFGLFRLLSKIKDVFACAYACIDVHMRKKKYNFCKQHSLLRYVLCTVRFSPWYLERPLIWRSYVMSVNRWWVMRSLLCILMCITAVDRAERIEVGDERGDFIGFINSLAHL